jgi:hypothetical protein
MPGKKIMKKIRGMILTLILASSLLTNSFAQGMIKDDFKVNDDTLGLDQDMPAIDVYPGENFAIVWQDQRNDGFDVYAQRLNPSGDMLGVNIMVNNQLTGDQKYPSLAFGPSGNFIVVWQDTRDGNRDVYAQKFNFLGDNQGSNFKVNDDLGTKPQIEPQVDFSTKIVVVWEDERSDERDILAQLLDTDCQFINTNFKINDDLTTSIQQRADVTSDDNGNFVVVWQDKREGNYDIYAQRFDSSGNFLDSNFKINDDTGTSLQNFPKVTSDSLGTFVVVWQDKRNGDEDVYAQIYDGEGEKIGENFRVNDDSGDAYQGRPSIAMDQMGNFVVAWVDKRNQDKDIYAQRYDFNFEPVSGNFRVNSDTGSAEQAEPSVGTQGERIYFTWVDKRNGDSDIFAKVVDWNWTEVREIEVDNRLSSSVLLQNYPNPFNSTTTIRFTVHGKRRTADGSIPNQKPVNGDWFVVDRPIPTTLNIYNIKGQMVRKLVDEDLEAGGYVVIWDGRDDQGNEVATGIYFYRLKISAYLETKKMLLLK